MNRKSFIRNVVAALAIAPLAAVAAPSEHATITPRFDMIDSTRVIPAEIYGQFAEHLGTCIYGGIWVGEDSPIPNTDGYRNDVLEALRELKVPVIRWPGGCFADEYHWMDGIGPREKRPVMVNTNWGGTVENNHFGTHEFFNLCELIGCEPYLSGNVGSGTVEELAKWVEYITAENGPMAEQRKLNGREKPWKLRYLGVGNESWGCGGNFTPEAYANEYRRYQTYCRNFNGNHLYKIASGASDYDYRWTDVLMKNARRHMQGLSLHYYTVLGWNGSKGSATEFTPEDYYWTLGKALEIDQVIARHDSIMTRHDPEHRVALLVDEWGTWWDEEPGTVRGHLYQQNSMRDAMVAALSLNVFHRHTDRVKMANIAQMVNVLQAMILTQDSAMVLTPTYHVFKMYAPHQNATILPLDIVSDTLTARDGRKIPAVSATASVKDSKVTVTLTNVNLDKPVNVTLPGVSLTPAATARILTAGNITDCNTFEKPDLVKPEAFKLPKHTSGDLTLTLPPKSIVSLTL